VQISSRDDRFTGNRIEGTQGRGGALEVAATSGSDVSFSMTNGAVAGNHAGTLGGGLFNLANCGSGCSVATTLRNSTIAGNTVLGQVSQLHQDGTNTSLSMFNSIVYNTGGSSDLSTGPTTTVRHSDACNDTGGPLPGAGNICRNPRLTKPGAGDVHQTRRSPTDDKGSNALVPSSLKTDFEGHRRILNSDSKAGARVDMGADELRPRARIGVVIGRGSVLVSGAVKPKNARKRVVVTLYRKKNGRFRKLATRRDRLNRRSRYAVRFGDPAPGRCRVKVAFLGSATTSPGAKTKKFSC
jgi:hypothetical protein